MGKNFADILLLMIALMLPMVFGYFTRIIKLFKTGEAETLQKFVVKVCVPFLIFNSLYKANVASLGQIFPSLSAFVLLTVFYAIGGYYLGPVISGVKGKQNSFIFTVFAGNYVFLGWGVIHSFYGEEALTRAVFFALFALPVFLVVGLVMVYRRGGFSTGDSGPDIYTVLIKNAGILVVSAILGISLNLLKVPLPLLARDFIEKFAAFAIPLILFIIGLNFTLKMPRSSFKIVMAGTVYRLVLGIIPGLAALAVTRFLFSADLLTQKVILMESIMPAAAITVFFTQYTEIDGELQAGIITFSTLLSLAAIPAWYVILESVF